MEYCSTRDRAYHKSAAEVILQGISSEGGLFIPRQIPALGDLLEQLRGADYRTVARAVMGLYLTDFTAAEVADCVAAAYDDLSFPEGAAPMSALGEEMSVLELWHGPTCAFKDMALQMLPVLMSASNKKVGDGKEIVILVATSGDTGKAALEGFKDVPGTQIAVFYPEEGVSHMQKRQMMTQEGQNVQVFGVKGNFDDCQTGVKAIFTDPAATQAFLDAGKRFSSANSINWGRLLPQVVYYVYAYLQQVEQGRVQMGQPVNFVVPTGNFGNILAAYLAGEMGLPVGKLICASNQNCVLTEFLQTGRYDRNRPFYTTISPSMDILISSNLERLIYLLSGGDDALVRRLYGQLTKDGTFTVDGALLERLRAQFAAGCATDDETADTIRAVFERYGYLCDTHTAVAVKVYRDYCRDTGDTTPTVVVSTASPYKFAGSVLAALGERCPDDDFAVLDALQAVSGVPVPAPLAALQGKKDRFTTVCAPADMLATVRAALGV